MLGDMQGGEPLLAGMYRPLAEDNLDVGFEENLPWTKGFIGLMFK